MEEMEEMEELEIPQRKMFERALAFEPIHDVLEPMGLSEEAQLMHLYLCYSTLGKQILEMEHTENREAGIMEAVLAAINLVDSGEFELREDPKTGAIIAVRVKKK